MQKLGLTKDEVRALLPNVGDELMRTPHLTHIMNLGPRPCPRLCVVDYVNTEHMWYRVRFVDTGLVESYGALEGIEKGVRFK